MFLPSFKGRMIKTWCMSVNDHPNPSYPLFQREKLVSFLTNEWNGCCEGKRGSFSFLDVLVAERAQVYNAWITDCLVKQGLTTQKAIFVVKAAAKCANSTAFLVKIAKQLAGGMRHSSRLKDFSQVPDLWDVLVMDVVVARSAASRFPLPPPFFSLSLSKLLPLRQFGWLDRLHGFYPVWDWISPVSTGCVFSANFYSRSKILLGFTGFYWVLLGFTGFYRSVIFIDAKVGVILIYKMKFRWFWWVLGNGDGFFSRSCGGRRLRLLYDECANKDNGDESYRVLDSPTDKLPKTSKISKEVRLYRIFIPSFVLID